MVTVMKHPPLSASIYPGIIGDHINFTLGTGSTSDSAPNLLPDRQFAEHKIHDEVQIKFLNIKHWHAPHRIAALKAMISPTTNWLI